MSATGPAWTASSADRVAVCAPSATLRRCYEVTGPASGGQAMASYLRRLETMDADAALALVDDEADRRAFAQIDVRRLPSMGTFAAEVAFVLNVTTGKASEIGRDIGRFYKRAMQATHGRDFVWNEIAGTADLVAIDGDRVVILDHKRGFASHVPPARRNQQLLQLLVSACRAYAKSEGTVIVTRILTDGSVFHDSADLDAMDVDMAAAELQTMHRRVTRARDLPPEEQTVTLSSLCRYCPSQRYCPAKIEVAAGVLGLRSSQLVALPELDQDDAMASLWARLPAAYKALDTLKADLQERAAQRPLALHSGKWLGEVTKPGKPAYDGKAVHALIDALHGKGVADAAVTMETSGAAIEAALKPLAGHGQLAGMVREVKAAIEGAKAVTRAPRTSVVEFEASKSEVIEMMRLRAERLAVEDEAIVAQLTASLEVEA